jgi:hypothetical protein
MAEGIGAEVLQMKALLEQGRLAQTIATAGFDANQLFDCMVNVAYEVCGDLDEIASVFVDFSETLPQGTLVEYQGDRMTIGQLLARVMLRFKAEHIQRDGDRAVELCREQAPAAVSQFLQAFPQDVATMALGTPVWLLLVSVLDLSPHPLQALHEAALAGIAACMGDRTHQPIDDLEMQPNVPELVAKTAKEVSDGLCATVSKRIKHAALDGMSAACMHLPTWPRSRNAAMEALLTLPEEIEEDVQRAIADVEMPGTITIFSQPLVLGLVLPDRIPALNSESIVASLHAVRSAHRQASSTTSHEVAKRVRSAVLRIVDSLSAGNGLVATVAPQIRERVARALELDQLEAIVHVERVRCEAELFAEKLKAATVGGPNLEAGIELALASIQKSFQRFPIAVTAAAPSLDAYQRLLAVRGERAVSDAQVAAMSAVVPALRDAMRADSEARLAVLKRSVFPGGAVLQAYNDMVRSSMLAVAVAYRELRTQTEAWDARRAAGGATQGVELVCEPTDMGTLSGFRPTKTPAAAAAAAAAAAKSRFMAPIERSQLPRRIFVDRSRAEIGSVWSWWLNPAVRVPNPLPESKIRQAYSHAVFFGFESVRAELAIQMKALAERA